MVSGRCFGECDGRYPRSNESEKADRQGRKGYVGMEIGIENFGIEDLTDALGACLVPVSSQSLSVRQCSTKK